MISVNSVVGVTVIHRINGVTVIITPRLMLAGDLITMIWLKKYYTNHLSILIR